MDSLLPRQNFWNIHLKNGKTHQLGVSCSARRERLSKDATTMFLSARTIISQPQNLGGQKRK